MTPATLAELLQQTAKTHPQKQALLFKENNHYLTYTYEEFYRRASAVATALLLQGVKPGDRIVMLSENRPEWVIVDMAAQMIGSVTVPIYTSLTPVEIEYILRDCAAGWVAVSNKILLEKLLPIHKGLPALRGFIGFDASLALEREGAGRPLLLIKDMEKTAVDTVRLEASIAAVRSDDLASIIYTSGTTGHPKGVMLTHDNFMQNVLQSRNALKMGETDVHLSFLPLCHVFERMAGYYLMLLIGATIAYAESMDSVPQNLREVRPTFILGVPRFYEKIKDRVLEAVRQGSPVKKALFFWAKELGEKKRKGAGLGKLFSLRLKLADLLVYKKFRQRLGGRVRFCVSGGAPLAKEIGEFFHDLGVMIYEGYGLTETSPVITVNREGRYKFGAVGIPLEEVQVRIAEDGEILTKSRCVMVGYYGKPGETADVIRDGWFHTGDLGQIDREGFLSITGRKKELIVTSGGKKISPRPIEEIIENDDYILRCVLCGEGRRFLTALLVPRKEKLIEYAEAQKIAYKDYADLLKNDKIYQFFEGRIEQLTADLARFEKVKYFALLENDFTQGSGELTPTLKVRREVVLSRYKEALTPLYAREKDA